jgi:hypothetical protein
MQANADPVTAADQIKPVKEQFGVEELAFVRKESRTRGYVFRMHAGTEGQQRD